MQMVRPLPAAVMIRCNRLLTVSQRSEVALCNVLAVAPYYSFADASASDTCAAAHM